MRLHPRLPHSRCAARCRLADTTPASATATSLPPLARKDILAEDCTVIRHAVITIQYYDTTAKARLSQGLCGRCASRSRPHDDEAPGVAFPWRLFRLSCRHTHPYAALHNARREARQWVHRGWIQECTGAQAEGGLVPGTDDLVVLTHALRHGPPACEHVPPTA